MHGFHHHESDLGFEKSEFERRYHVPEMVDTHTLTSKITADGVLCIEAVSKPKLTRESSTDDQLVNLSDNFKISLSVSEYKPDEVSIKVVGRELVVHGETRDEDGGEHGQIMHHKQFTRHFNIPEDVNMDSLSSRYNRNGELTIEAARMTKKDLPERHLQIQHDDTEQN